MNNFAICSQDESFIRTMRDLLLQPAFSSFEVQFFLSAADLVNSDVPASEPISVLLGMGVDATAVKKAVDELLLRFPQGQIILHSQNDRDYFKAYDIPHFRFIADSDLLDFLPETAYKLSKKIAEQRFPVLVIKYHGKEQLIKQTDIVYLRHFTRTTYVKLTDGRELATKLDLDEACHSLLMPPFWRCHKSYCVNWDHVSAFRRDGYIMDNDDVIPISRSHQEKSREAFYGYLKMCRNKS